MPFVRITMINVVLAFMIIGSFLVAVIIHEFGHSLVASMLGDPTPQKEGRLSPSLRTHLDPVGTMLCVILAFFPVAAGPVGLGWGKPVKVDPWKLRGGPNFGTLLVTLSGILMSLVVGVLFALLLRFLPQIVGLIVFFLFHIPTYILLASNYLTSFVSGLPSALISMVYFF